MKTAIEMFVPQFECGGRWDLRWYQRWRVDLCCWLLGHALWRMLGPVSTGGGWQFYATICLRCGRGGYFQQDYFDKERT